MFLCQLHYYQVSCPLKLYELPLKNNQSNTHTYMPLNAHAQTGVRVNTVQPAQLLTQLCQKQYFTVNNYHIDDGSTYKCSLIFITFLDF